MRSVHVNHLKFHPKKRRVPQAVQMGNKSFLVLFSRFSSSIFRWPSTAMLLPTPVTNLTIIINAGGQLTSGQKEAARKMFSEDFIAGRREFHADDFTELPDKLHTHMHTLHTLTLTTHNTSAWFTC